MQEQITIFTDGGSRKNPGIAGAGAVIFSAAGEEIAATSQFLGIKTNNWAEYEAVLLGLQLAYEKFGEKLLQMKVVLKLDSQLVQRQLLGEYQIKEKSLLSQNLKVKEILKHFNHIEFVHIPRSENKRADELANLAMDTGNN